MHFEDGKCYSCGRRIFGVSTLYGSDHYSKTHRFDCFPWLCSHFCYDKLMQPLVRKRTKEFEFHYRS